jgi:catechol 2,3-dioxygenase-like lactoylglutathione lyase family enzyme
MAGKKKKKDKKGKKAAKKAAKAAKEARKAAPKAAKRTVEKPVARRRPARRAVAARQQPESLRLRSAGPGFTVNDIEKSLAFYRDVLGFTLKERWEQDGALHGVELVAGSVTFWLGQDDWKKGRDRVKGQGFRLYCVTAQDIDALAQRVKTGGGVLLEEPKDQPWGGRACAVVDPDGFTITFATGL